MNDHQLNPNTGQVNATDTQLTLCTHECRNLEGYYASLFQQVYLSVVLSEQDKVGQIRFLLQQWSNELE